MFGKGLSIELPWQTMKWKHYKLLRNFASGCLSFYAGAYVGILILAFADLYYRLPDTTDMFLGIIMGGIGGWFLSAIYSHLEELYTKLFDRLPVESIEWNL